MKNFKVGEIVAVNSTYLFSLPEEDQDLGIFHLFKIVEIKSRFGSLKLDAIKIEYTTFFDDHEPVKKLYKNNKLNKKLYYDRIIEETKEWLIVD